MEDLVRPTAMEEELASSGHGCELGRRKGAGDGAMEEDLAQHPFDLAWTSGDGAKVAGQSRGSGIVPCRGSEKRRAGMEGRERRWYEREEKGK
jgi:hypothetical protein